MKLQLKKISLAVIKALTMLSVFLAVIGGALATSLIPSESIPLPPSWRPYMASIAFGAIAVKWLLVPTIDALIKAMRAALAELEKPEE